MDNKETKNHPATECCNHVYTLEIPYPVYWNEFNKVVQCHSCGQVYKPRKLTVWEKIKHTFKL